MQAEARPRPVAGRQDQPGADWIHVNVVDDPPEITIVKAGIRPVPRLEKVAGSVVLVIDPLGVTAHDSVHDRRQRDQADFDRHMEMISHQAIRDNFRARFDPYTTQLLEKLNPISVV
jgi:hypothetical protein